MSAQTLAAITLHDAICSNKDCRGPIGEHSKLFLVSARELLEDVTNLKTARKAAFGVYYAQLHNNGKGEFDAVNLALKIYEILSNYVKEKASEVT